ncbi:AAA family ATPase [Candidatus Gottesmanbacteria bacterium]|nr:AAA family ATPase [Candidatus Gottesmanbacteria bacterium]
MDTSAQSNNSNETAELAKLKQQLSAVSLPPDLKEKADSMINRAALSFKYGGYFTGFDQVASYVDWITNLPWDKRSSDNLDINHAKDILEKYHYGLKDIKDRILEYLSVMKLNIEQSKKEGKNEDHNFMRAPILFFVGLVGTGKTTIAKSIAEAMNRPFVRIPFGGMGSALDLRGQSRVHPDAEVGQVMKALRRAATKNPVILLDELDRVTEEARSDIMGVLVELLDPEQNSAFVDHYIDYPFNLSEVLFIATANNTGNISTAVMDRLEPIQMPSYNDDEKIIIGKSYVFPKIKQDAGLNDSQLQIDDNVWPQIVRPLGFDSGIRTLERTINGVCRKVARMIVEGKGQSFHITVENVKQFLPTW